MDRPDLSSPRVLRDFVQRHGLAPRKGLGQHWLRSKRVVDSIVQACSSCRGILEIGPGTGVLTGPLSEIASVVAMDLDGRTEAALAESAPKAKVMIADVLHADLAHIISGLGEPRCVVSNLPYYITGAVISRLCVHASLLDQAVLMMQAEVADRITAEPGQRERGSLSVLVQHAFAVSTVCKVPPSAFMPPPKVDSKVLLMQSRKRGLEPYLEIVRRGFQQPRKTLANNLKGVVTVEQITASGLDPLVRPHQLSEDDWRRLASQESSPN